MTAFTGILFVAGLLLLVLGAEALVRGASRLAIAAGITPLVVGLTVVAYGTSMPEAAVSVQAALGGTADIAIGNVVGSNIFNILLILGLSAVVAPLTVSTQLVRIDVPIMIITSALFYALAANGAIGRVEGVLLLGLMVGYTVFVVRLGRRTARDAAELAAMADDPVVPRAAGGYGRNVAFVVAGLVLLLLGARALVTSAIVMATALGMSPLVIGLTIVAGGTSLPELATSVAATIRGQRDIAVGNVVGSNIFNILFVLGATATVAPAGIEVAGSALSLDIPVALAAAAACLPIFFTGYRIARWEGAVFVFYYIAYTAYLVLHGAEHEVAPVLLEVVAGFVAPLTLITVGVVAWRQWRHARSR